MQWHEDTAPALPDVTWPLLVLDATVSDQLPAHLRGLAYAVTEAVTVESDARAAMRAVTRAIFQDELDVLDAAIAALLTAADGADLAIGIRIVGNRSGTARHTAAVGFIG